MKTEDQLLTLSNQEFDLINQLQMLSGTIEDKSMQIAEQDICEAYNHIFIQYSNLSNNSEALKRAIFIQWYASYEPSIYSGIDLLNKDNQISNLERLLDRIEKDQIDQELKVMLKHYYKVAEYYFNAFGDFSLIESFPSSLDSKTSIYENRGQMGLYWNSLNY